MKKLLSRLLLLAVIVDAAQLALAPRLRPMKDVKRLDRCLAQNPDVIFFCDSTNGWFDANDDDRRSIAAMLGANLAEYKVLAVDRGAYHLEVYEALVDRLIARGAHPQVVLAPINLRSLSPEWDLRPAYQFEQCKRELRHADNPFYLALCPLLRTLQLIDESPISQHEFKDAAVYKDSQCVGKVRDFDNPHYTTATPQRTRNKLIYHYMYPLDGRHRKLAALRRLVEKSRAAGLHLLFYVPPIDCQTGEQYLPGEFRRHVAANVNTILRQIDDDGPPVIDLAFALPADAFSYHDYPNEHLRQSGRRLVAWRLAEALHRRYGVALSPRWNENEIQESPHESIATRVREEPPAGRSEKRR